MTAPDQPWNTFRPPPTRTEQLADAAQEPKSLVVSWFPTAMPVGPAIGDPEATTWSAFTSLFRSRREGPKDGTLFCPCRFRLEPDGRHVRRLTRNVIARTAVALDCETNKQTGEIPPAVDEVVRRVRAMGWAAVVYTSHSHVLPVTNVRYRVVLPLEEEINPELPAPEIVADALGLAGVLDHSKLNAASIFYLPSCADIAQEDQHQTIVCPGAALDAAWVRKTAGTLLAERQAEQDRIAAEAHAAAQRRLESRIAAGFNPDDSLIEKLRSRFDLAAVLAAHGYHRQGTKFRHPNSSSGSYGADIKTYGGIERVYSHNGTDPLHRDNLPDWCGGVTALDVVDAVTILDFAGDRTRALRELAQRFGLTKAEERKAVAKLIFRMMRQQAPREAIDAAARAEGLRLGLSPAEVIAVANWCVQNLQGNSATAPDPVDLSDHPEETGAPGDADSGDASTPEGEQHQGQGTTQPPAHELPRIKWTNERLSDWADRDITERLWVVPEWIPRGQCTGLYGVGGVNKTDFLIQLGVAKSKGLPFLGHMLEAGPVYALFLEDSREEIIRRAIRIAKTAWGYDSLDAFRDFHFVSLVGFDEPEFVAFDGTKMEIKQALYLVDQKIMEIGAHLCTLDTLPHFFGGNEIVRREVSRFIRKLDGISIVRQCAFVASAHPSARGRQTGSMESGSTGWEGGFRARLGLHDPGLDGDDEDKQAPRIASDRRILTRIKSNYAKQGETLDLVIRDGTFFVTAVGPEVANHPPKSGPGRDAACDDRFLALIAAVEGQGSHVNESVHSGRYAPKEFAKHPRRGDFREQEFTRAMRRLFEAKRIKVIDFGPPSRGWRKIIDVQAEPEVAPEVAPDPTPPAPPSPSKEEIDAAVDAYLKLDEGERVLQRIPTAERLGNMKLGVFDGLVAAARKKAKPDPTHGGPRPGSGRKPAEDGKN